MKKDFSFYFKRIAERMVQEATVNLNADSVTFTQGRALAFLDSKPGKSSTQKEMQDFFHVSHPTITGIVHRMEERGLVQIVPSRKGRESNHILLTEKGLEVCRKNERIECGRQKEMLKGFTNEEKIAFESMLQRICENVCQDDQA